MKPGRPRPAGVALAGTGVAVPPRQLTNADLAQRVDTTDAWITQRTGIRTRHVVEDGVTTRDLARDAVNAALRDAQLDASEVDLLLLATLTPEMTCPSTSARVAAEVGASPAGAMDLAAACSGFVYGMNLAAGMIESGRARHVVVVGAEAMTSVLNYEDRRTCILFGDAASAVVLRASDDEQRGCLHQSMHSDGSRWGELYLPRRDADVPAGLREQANGEAGWNGKLGTLQMNGREVFKFAVLKTEHMIQSALDAAGVTADDLAMVIPHQSNQRILSLARDRFGLPPEKMHINIDRFGNTSAASVGLCLHECRAAGTVKPGDLVLFIAVGGGMTWATSLWRV